MIVCKRLLMLVPLAALLTGCPEDEKKDPPPAANASASAVPTQTVAAATASATATATADAGRVADAGKDAAAAPKK